METGPIYFDINSVLYFLNTNSSFKIISLIMAVFGWVIITYLLIYIGLWSLKIYREEIHKKNWKWVLLAIDIPQLNLQTPKGVEQMFAHLAGALKNPNVADIYSRGFKQKWFSFEIISIEGYIQFLIRTEESFRDLVEAAVYAQYPMAEIAEVEDYTTSFPSTFPDKEYEMWGGDFGLAESFAYPIRTYNEFEHISAEENKIKDPMGTFLESFSRIGHGENVWFQLLIEPTNNAWKEKVIAKIKDMVGEVVSITGFKKSGGYGKMFTEEPKKVLVEFVNQIFGNAGEAKEIKEKKEDGSKLGKLTPGQRKLLEAMENKIMKIGFKTKIRVVYVARKEVFKPERSVNAIIGAINQFNIPSANSIIPTSTANTNYFFTASRGSFRKRLMMNAYKKRKMKAGGNPFILNIEEWATIWHFPLSYVKTPLLQRTEGKRAEPPAGLPMEYVSDVKSQLIVKKPRRADNKKIVTDAGDVAYLDNGKEYG